MKLFIKSILYFFFPIILLAYPIDFYISDKLKQSHDYYGEFEVWNDIYNSNINTDIAIYGSSRAWVDISPKILEDSLQLNTYNFGIDGHNFWLQYLRHKEYLKYNPPPKQILLVVDFNSLQKRENLYLSEQFLPYMLWNKDMKNFTHSYGGFHVLDYYIPLIRYLGKSSVLVETFNRTLNKTNKVPYRTQGYKGVEKNWTNALKHAKTKMANYEVKIDTASKDLFETFLKECNDKDIKVTLVYTPEYIEGQKFIKNRQEIIELYQLYAKEHNIVFLNYSNSTINNNKNYFYNATHLNKIGAELFSRILASDLLKMED